MRSEKKKLPIGIEMFRKIRTAGFYYADKTGFIKELLTSWAEVNLITRPRRFGKSLNMDMLRTFFEIGTDPSLFQGLQISEEADLCEAHMGKYPVISISLKDVEGSSFEEAKDMLGAVVNEAAMRFQMLMDSTRLTEYEKKQLERLLLEDFGKTTYLTGSLKLLSKLLYKHYEKPVILLIDEYDVPLDKAYQNKYYPQMVSLTRSLFSQVLKTNPYLQFAIITGCLRIAKESIFTGLNNFKVRTISDVRYARYFGFTADDVKELLSYYELDEKFDDLKEWYDGYHFGELQSEADWVVKSNLESGIGYTDILIAIPKEKIGCVIETKYAEQGAFDGGCSEAMKQIEDNSYTALLKEMGMKKIHTYGVACYKKSCRVIYKEEVVCQGHFPGI